MNDDKYLLSSVTHSIQILDLLAENQIMSVAEISQKMNINKTSVFRYLYTLESGGYVYKTMDAKYMLGKKFAYMGAIVEERQTEYSLAKPELLRLRDRLNETAHLSILLSDLTMMFVEKADSSQAFQMRSRIGYQMPAYCNASGKVLLAGLLGTEREEELKKLKLVSKTPRTITDPVILMKELQKVRERGYGTEDGEAEENLSCIAVPLRTADGKVMAAVSVSGLSSKLQENRETYLEALREAAESIEQVLGL